MAKWFDKLVGKNAPKKKKTSFLRGIVSGSFYKVSDLRGDTALSDIRTQIDTMRALARDSQISTALSTLVLRLMKCSIKLSRLP